MNCYKTNIINCADENFLGFKDLTQNNGVIEYIRVLSL